MYTEKKENKTAVENQNIYAKETIKKTLMATIAGAFEEETRLATQEMEKERQKAINAIVEEGRVTIRQAVEDGKKTIWTTSLTGRQPGIFKEEVLEEISLQSIAAAGIEFNRRNGNKPKDDSNEEATDETNIELIILPPRDQNEIAVINTYLINMPEIRKVELVNMVDKSVFKIVQKEPVNLVDRLNMLPQVLNAVEVVENNRKKITITLLAKLKLERNNNMVNTKVNEIFSKRKR